MEKFEGPLHAIPEHTLLTDGIRRYRVTRNGFTLQSLGTLGGAPGAQESDQAGVAALERPSQGGIARAARLVDIDSMIQQRQGDAGIGRFVVG